MVDEIENKNALYKYGGNGYRSLENYIRIIEAQEMRSPEELGFEYSFLDFITQRYHDLGNQPLSWLDSGAGIGFAMDDLLSSFQRKHMLEKAVGVGKHNFEHTKELLQRHPERMYYFWGDALEIIPILGKFDVITDIFGAYYYSEDKIDLLRTYYDALRQGGQAFITTRNNSNDYELTMDTVSFDNRLKYLKDFLAEYIPEIFKRTNKNSTLVMIKDQEEFPDIDLEVLDSYYSDIDTMNSFKKYTREDAEYRTLMPVVKYKLKETEN
jgi:SAM-dependent methyltransferase